MRKNLGFTLIELMVVISIVSILSALAIPNFLGWLSSAKLNGAARDLISDLSWVKSRALKTNRPMEIFFVKTGYSVFDDENGNDVVDSGEIIREKKYPAGVLMNVADRNMKFFRTGAVSPAGSIPLTRVNGQGLKVVISLVGRIRTENI